MSVDDCNQLVKQGLFESITNEIESEKVQMSLSNDLKLIKRKYSSRDIMNEQSMQRKRTYKKHYKGHYLFYEKIRPGVSLYKLNGIDCGYSILNDMDIIFKPHEQKILYLGLNVNIYKGYCGMLYFTEEFKEIGKFMLCSGIIDASYNDELKVTLLNLSNDEQCLQKDSYIFKIVIVKVFDKSPRCIETTLYCQESLSDFRYY